MTISAVLSGLALFSIAFECHVAASGVPHVGILLGGARRVGRRIFWGPMSHTGPLFCATPPPRLQNVGLKRQAAAEVHRAACCHRETRGYTEINRAFRQGATV